MKYLIFADEIDQVCLLQRDVVNGHMNARKSKLRFWEELGFILEMQLKTHFSRKVNQRTNTFYERNYTC